LDYSEEWEIYQIFDSRLDCYQKGLGLLYLVEWKGFDNTPDATSWESPKHLMNAPDVVSLWNFPLRNFKLLSCSLDGVSDIGTLINNSIYSLND